MRTLMRMLSLVAVVSATSLGAEANPKQAEPVVTAVEIRVDDLEAAVEFYCGVLQFERANESSPENSVILAHDGAKFILKKVSSRSKVDYENQAHVNLNMMVADLAGFVNKLRHSKGTVLDSTPQPAQIGVFYRVLDPAGNMLHIIEPNFDMGPLPKPVVFNLGIQVTDMKKAREFYIGKLGFPVYSEKYYPPVVPLKSAGVELILHEGSATAASRRSLDETGISIVVSPSGLNGDSTQNAKLEYDPDGNLLIVELQR